MIGMTCLLGECSRIDFGIEYIATAAVAQAWTITSACTPGSISGDAWSGRNRPAAQISNSESRWEEMVDHGQYDEKNQAGPEAPADELLFDRQ
jgi:hypothetical protein